MPALRGLSRGVRTEEGFQKLAVPGGQVRSVAVDFDGHVAVVGGNDGAITVWELPSGQQLLAPVRTGHRDVRKVLLSRDGKSIISCGADGAVERRSVTTGELLGQVQSDFVDAVETIALMPDGELVVAGSDPPPQPATGHQGSGPALVSLNSASPEQLATLPGIGPTLATRIVQWREQNGRFTAVDELLAVAGIGPAKYEAIAELVTL